MNHLTNSELLRLAHTQLDPITSTELERELLRRLEAFVDQEPMLDAMDEGGFDTENMRALAKAIEAGSVFASELPDLVKVLDEFNCSDTKSLREKLERADKWFGIAEEAGDLFQRLQDLTNTTL